MLLIACIFFVDKTSVLKAHKEILLTFYTITIKKFISFFLTKSGQLGEIKLTDTYVVIFHKNHDAIVMITRCIGSSLYTLWNWKFSFKTVPNIILTKLKILSINKPPYLLEK